jgi:DNA-binding NarL/FixJ family response regulator
VLEAILEKSTLRVLIVDDYEPFRQFIATKLQTNPQLRIVKEACDGAEAVQQAQELQPDLILLDIGLPTLNGIEAARRIRKVSPTSKILFVTENRSTDIAEEALSTGAGGYVVKSNAGSELLPAIEAVLRGKQFVSAGLNDRNSIATADRALHEKVVARSRLQSVERHELRLYADDTAFVDGLAQSIEATLENRNAIVVIVTESHRANLLQQLRVDGVDVDSAVERRLLILLDVADSLSIVTVDAATDENRSAGLPHIIVEAMRTAKDGHRHVAVC